MNFNYDFDYVVNLKASSFFGAAEYFIDKHTNNIAIISSIEDAYMMLPSSFSIEHPNVTTSIGESVYNKDKREFYFQSDINVNVGSFGGNYDSDNDSIQSEESLILNKHVLGTLQRLNSDYLFKTESEHTVTWFYRPILDVNSESFAQSDIPSYQFSRLMFHRKINENFYKILDDRSDYDSDSISTKGRLENVANSRFATEITCNPVAFESNEYIIKDLVFSTKIGFTQSFKISNILFHQTYEFSENRPFTFEYGDSLFVKIDLSNITTFMLNTSIPFADAGELDIISDEKLNTHKDEFLRKDVASISDEYSIDVSGGRLAVTYRYIADMITRRITSYFSAQLKMFLGDYVDGGALSELIKYILDKIAELESKYIKNDECTRTRPVRNIDEGCKIDCLTLSFGKTKKMITKQRLKAQIGCALNCKGDRNDWV